ncbi:zinc finger BED domain-containing protein RICESLEEPER 4-like [Gossypium arboreum]|uniref:zinc finger BED domain-containing protein RICESLEEPER 4-like n=1 Tax=Gossypium arboreum TaxID=29729 RepID=UPI00081908BF|nr:zinc finger BED domain-containing protein RICESLEEPER 4-like [Gossypium arboreum]
MSDPKRDGSTQSSQNSSPSRDDQTTTKENVRKKITPRAACWNHFTKFVTEEGEKRARCNACDVTYTMESTSGSTTNLNNRLKACLKRPRGNTSNPKQSELTFVKVSQETIDLSTWVFDKDAVRKALRISYMVLTAHWVDDEWRLQKRIISFCPISAYRGESIGQAIEKCLRDSGIERVFTITVDNASANSVAIEYLRKKLNHQNASIANGKFIHMRCVAHILNLIVQYGIKDASVSVD